MKQNGKNTKVLSLVKIAIMGPKRSGKSTLIVMLQFCDRDGWNIRPISRKAQQLYILGTRILRQDLEPLSPTAPGDTEFLSFDFEGPGGLLPNSRIRYQVLIPDCAGELFEEPTKAPPQLVKDICGCDGIIWMVDPIQIDKPDPKNRSYTEMIQEWLYILYDAQDRTGRLKQYLAFCLTKMDHPNHLKHINEPRKYCLEKLGSEVQTFLYDYADHRKVAYFSTSSYGFDPTKQIVNYGTTSQDGELIRKPNPIGLFEPFKWLFGVIPTKPKY